MPNLHEPARNHRRLLPLIRYALREGWEISRTAGGHLRFIKAGLPPIYTSAIDAKRRETGRHPAPGANEADNG